MTDQELQAIKQRAAMATTGPWMVEAGDYSGRDWLIGVVAVYLGASCQDDKCYSVTTRDVHASELSGDARTDAEFIAHARTDIAALIAEVERLRLLLDVCEAQEARLRKLEQRLVELEDHVWDRPSAHVSSPTADQALLRNLELCAMFDAQDTR